MNKNHKELFNLYYHTLYYFTFNKRIQIFLLNYQN